MEREHAHAAFSDRCACACLLSRLTLSPFPNAVCFQQCLRVSLPPACSCTGNGGFVQNFMFGYAALRLARLGVLQFGSAIVTGAPQAAPELSPMTPLLPPHGVTAVKLRSIWLLGSAFTMWYNSSVACVELVSAADTWAKGSHAQRNAALELRRTVGGRRGRRAGAVAATPLAPGNPVCFGMAAAAPFFVAGQDYP